MKNITFDLFCMKIVAIFFCLVSCTGRVVWGQRTHPTVVREGGRDIHYFTTSGWLGLREGVVVARGVPLALTCDFRDKVRRKVGPDGVMRSEVVTNTTSVNITFPSGAGQVIRRISPHVNLFKAWRSYHPEVTVFFPAVTNYTLVQCQAEYLEADKTHLSIIEIPVTPIDGVSVWKRSENMKDVSEVECKAYDSLVSRVTNYSREMYDVVSLMMADETVLTTIPRTAVLLPFNGSALLRTGALNRTKERLSTVPDAAKRNITCVVYHVHRPVWGVFVTEYEQRRRVSWWIVVLIVGLLAVLLVIMLRKRITVTGSIPLQKHSAIRLYGQL